MRRLALSAGIVAALLVPAGAGHAAAVKPAAAAAAHRILFDNTKAETAGNADWIIGTSQPDPTGQNASPASEKDWTGALSAWGVALQRTGQYSLKTLPAGNTITYGNSGNPLDLSNFDEFVLPEPNVLLSTAEKAAVMHFVQNGGGLFLISDHNGSDRNNDGADSPAIINNLMTSNGVDNTDPFGFSVDVKNISSDHPVAISDSGNPVLNGTFGAVHHSLIASGTTFTLKPADNPAVKGLLYLSTATPGNTNAFFVTSTFGTGRVAIWGDSSTIDDGTGQSGNTLYNGWSDSTADNAALGLNATAWLAGAGTSDGGVCTSAGQKVANPGFESGAAGWTAGSGIVGQHGTTEPARTGTWNALLGGLGTAHTDTLSQPVALPASCTANLSFWLHIDTAETGTTAYDTMKVQLLNGSGTVLSTLATYSNVTPNSGYAQHTFNVSAYAGQTVTLRFTATEGSIKQTSFAIDDTALTAS